MELKSRIATYDKPDAPEKESRLAEFRQYKEEHGTDFILDEADRLITIAGGDPDMVAGVYTSIVKLLFEYPKEYQREYYVKALGRRHKPMKVWKQEYEAQKELITEEVEADNAPSMDADTSTLEKFGFYTEDNKYWFAGSHGFTEGTNFVVEPLFHIYSPTNNRRLLRITNEFNHSVLADLPSDALVSVDKFQSFMINEGNFIIFINNQMFKKLLRYIGEKFPRCYEIKTFGWQPEGFWAFADGAYNGKWTPVDNMGIMRHSSQNYFSPAFSDVYSQLRTDDDIYENDRRFVYRNGGTTVKQWSDMVQLVFGVNGQYGVAYLVSAIFRSVIYDLYKIFPHLFLHGEKGSGKSQLGWSLNNVFQQGAPPFNLSSGTDVAFFRWLARYRNVVIWYDEYTDAIDEKRFQALKSAYDGVGREKGKMSRDSRTESDKINSASVISGQHLPQRDDNSLYTRSIVRFFSKPKDGFSREQTARFDRLRRMEESGLSGVVTQLLDCMPVVSSKFGRRFVELFERMKEELIGRGKQVDDRILRNYTILAAVVDIVQNDTSVDISLNARLFATQCLNDAIEQSDKVNSSDALATFWRILNGLIQGNEITKRDYDIQRQWTEKIVKKVDGERDSEEVRFKDMTRVLYLDFDQVYQKYMEAHRRIFGVIGLGMQTIMDYTHHHFSYIGLKASHYFADGKRTSAHMFNYDELVHKNLIPDLESVIAPTAQAAPVEAKNELPKDEKLPF